MRLLFTLLVIPCFSFGQQDSTKGITIGANFSVLYERDARTLRISGYPLDLQRNPNLTISLKRHTISAGMVFSSYTVKPTTQLGYSFQLNKGSKYQHGIETSFILYHNKQKDDFLERSAMSLDHYIGYGFKFFPMKRLYFNTGLGIGTFYWSKSNIKHIYPTDEWTTKDETFRFSNKFTVKLGVGYHFINL